MEPGTDTTPQYPPQPAQAPQPESPAPAPSAVSYNSQQMKRPSKLPVILLAILCLVLAAGCGYLGYMYKTTHDKLQTAQASLTSVQSELAGLKSSSGEAAAFIAKYNDAALSRNLCSNQPLLMSDVHVNDKFTVFRYLCSNVSQPILIGAFAKHADGTTDFTYSSNTSKPNQLPGYIYDSEPGFFGTAYKATRF